MPFVYLADRSQNLYYTINPIWRFSTALSTIPLTSKLDPSKPNVLLVHASGSSSQSFQRQYHDPRLAGGFNLISFDAPLHGLSSGLPQTDYTIEDVADDYVAGLDAVFGEGFKFSILAEGYFGSNCATWIAHKRPEQVQSLIYASPGWFEEEGANKVAMREWLELCLSNKNANGDESGTLPAEALYLINEYYFAGTNREKERQAMYTTAFQSRYGAGHSAHDLEVIMSWYNRKPIPQAVLGAITVPVMILAGELDQASPLGAAEQWKAALTGVRFGASLHLIVSAPHLVAYTADGVVNRLLYRFLTSALGLNPPDSTRPMSVALPETL